MPKQSNEGDISRSYQDEIYAELIKQTQLMQKQEARRKAIAGEPGAGEEYAKIKVDEAREKKARQSQEKRKRDQKKYFREKARREKGEQIRAEKRAESNKERTKSIIGSTAVAGALGAAKAGITQMDYAKTGLEKRQSWVEAGTAAGGAGIGAVIGSFIAPGIGTAIGASLGGSIGDKIGELFGMATKKERVAGVETQTELEKGFLPLLEAGISGQQLLPMMMQEADVIASAKLRREQGRELIQMVATDAMQGRKDLPSLQDQFELYSDFYNGGNRR